MRMIAVRSPIMPVHMIDLDDVTRVEWNAFCQPAVRLEFGNGNWSIITRECALALVKMGAIASPA